MNDVGKAIHVPAAAGWGISREVMKVQVEKVMKVHLLIVIAFPYSALCLSLKANGFAVNLQSICMHACIRWAYET